MAEPAADLSDEDYGAIAAAAVRFYAHMIFESRPLQWKVVDKLGENTFPPTSFDEASSLAIALNGRAAVAEYKRRRK